MVVGVAVGVAVGVGVCLCWRGKQAGTGFVVVEATCDAVEESARVGARVQAVEQQRDSLQEIGVARVVVCGQR